MKSSTTNVETSNVEIPSHEEEVSHESSESFQEESSSSSLNENIQQSLEEVRVPSSNTQSFSNDMIPNDDVASTSHNVFNERLEDAYFDASTSFHDPSNVHTFYYLHEKKWTKDHPLHKIIGDPKSSVHTRGLLANSCLFSCLLSSIEPVNVAKALRDIDWAMKMEHYLSHTYYPIWQVIHNRNGPISVIIDTNRIIQVLPPKIAKEVVARERERKARTTLLMALLEDHLAKFHKIDDVKEMWEAIKSRFEGLHKGYDRFQTLLSQLEIHSAGVSHEDANQKFLRSLPSSSSQVALIVKTKPGLDTLSFDDLYNNLGVCERDVKGTTASSSNTQIVAFVSAENTSITNDISTAYSVSQNATRNPQNARNSQNAGRIPQNATRRAQNARFFDKTQQFFLKTQQF
uniref:Ribonuclease H-like domain-containing protein n=1 Tax=Tanacetum cinerariifolium TaxID=118510 RepID=A0A699HT07_TANCI|nr:ribonuclease H-like domain-containing protein [Tanacetum cinerariifolium]